MCIPKKKRKKRTPGPRSGQWKNSRQNVYVQTRSMLSEIHKKWNKGIDKRIYRRIYKAEIIHELVMKAHKRMFPDKHKNGTPEKYKIG